MMIKNLLLILIIIKTKVSYSYIVLPFNNENSNYISNEISLKDEINFFLEPEKPYTLISISDKSTIEFYFSLSYFYFFIGKGLCRENTFSEYSSKESNTFKNLSYCANSVGYINNVWYTQDKITLFNGIKFDNNVTLNNLSFLFGISKYKSEKSDSNKICGYIGLQIEYNNLDYKEYNFIKILKQEKIIPTYTWSIQYFSENMNNMIPDNIKKNNEGFFMVGIEEKDYKDIYLTEDIRTINAKPRYGLLDWGIIFNEIYFHKKENYGKSCYQGNIQIVFDLESKFIISNKYFFEHLEEVIFKPYIKQQICFINEELKHDGKFIILCEKSFSKNISSFPNLYFFHKELNYTFVLSNEELFASDGNYIYFLIIHKVYYIDYWSLGTIFLKKYPFLFDYDKKTISFINIYNKTKANNIKENNIEVKESKFHSFVSFIKNISIVLGVIIGILIGKKIWDKNRKKRANELIDDYLYESCESKKIESKDLKKKENQLYEMN